MLRAAAEQEDRMSQEAAEEPVVDVVKCSCCDLMLSAVEMRYHLCVSELAAKTAENELLLRVQLKRCNDCKAVTSVKSRHRCKAQASSGC